MPGGDRTGPRGEGPRTGWGMGYCGPDPAAESSPQGAGFGRGFGFGFGRGRGRGRGGGGRGWRNLFHLTGLTGWQRAAQADVVEPSAPSSGQEQALRDRVTTLEAELAELKHRADEPGA
ncbi:MAG: DUF5320 domain-containing protein [Pirellulales bacterium]